MLGKLTDLPSSSEKLSAAIASEQACAKKELLKRSTSAEHTNSSPTFAESLLKNSGMGALMGTLGEAQDQLQKRGEKLEQLSDKTDKLARNADQFAMLAKQLNKEQSSWW